MDRLSLKFLLSGKVKDIFELDKNTLIFKFTDRISAFDVLFNELIPKKGEILCKFSDFWFNNIPIENHFINLKSKNEIIVKKLKMIPLECIVRGYYYGSIVNRTTYINKKKKLASKFDSPIFDPTTKSKFDIPITKTTAIQQNIITASEYDWLSKTSIKIYKHMSNIIENAGFILVDLKLEFGKIGDKILLADSIGPDEYRLWSKKSYKIGKIQESYDKQILRDWLILHNYKNKFDSLRKTHKTIFSPPLSNHLINKISNTYINMYKLITQKDL